jgi:hypothetical protein
LKGAKDLLVPRLAGCVGDILHFRVGVDSSRQERDGASIAVWDPQSP